MLYYSTFQTKRKTGTYKVRNEIETKRNETKRNEINENETKSTKWKRNKTKPTKAKRNQLKQNEIDWYEENGRIMEGKK
jgi:hypothetical protein